MWPFKKKLCFPDVKENQDGTISFSMTEEESVEADLALKAFEGYIVHPEAAERIRNGTIAVALSHYACRLINDFSDIDENEFKSKQKFIHQSLGKAIAAVWKSYSLYQLPIFIYHRAFFYELLGRKEEAKNLFILFLKMQSEFIMNDDVDKNLLQYEGTDKNYAISHAEGVIL